MPRNVFDQACRYLAKLDPLAFLCWLLGLKPAELFFRGWLDTRRIPFPGEPDRACDTVAHVEDVPSGQEPWALVLEFQMEPDPLFFGRAMIYGGQLWMEMKPAAERGDRFHIGIVVINLTGHGNAGRTMQLRGTRILTALQPQELNLCDLDAKAMLDGIAAKRVPGVVLPLIPLMQGGGDSAIIQQCLSLVSAEPNDRRRSEYGGLARVFAEAAGCVDPWTQALKGWNMKQSQVVLEWQAEARIEERAEALLEVLGLKFGAVPADLASVIRAATDVAQLRQWLAAAVTAASLDQFRGAAGL